MLYTVQVPISSSNIRGTIMSSWCRNSSPVPCLQGGHWETPATKATEAAVPWREPGDMCDLATQRTFLTQEEMGLAQTSLCCPLLPKKREVTCDSSGFILNGSVCLK